MSYHDGMGIPMLRLTGFTGAFGNTKLTCSNSFVRAASSAMKLHPAPVSPRPCKKITAAVAGTDLAGNRRALKDISRFLLGFGVKLGKALRKALGGIYQHIQSRRFALSLLLCATECGIIKTTKKLGKI